MSIVIVIVIVDSSSKSTGGVLNCLPCSLESPPPMQCMHVRVGYAHSHAYDPTPSSFCPMSMLDVDG